MQIYVENMITKSKKAQSHATNLRETFENIKHHSMRLNPARCSFELTTGKFLGFLITQRDIEANPSEIKAIMEMNDPENMKEVQILTGCIATLRRFIPQSSK